MSDSELVSAASPYLPPTPTPDVADMTPPKPWGPWATLLWGLLVGTVFFGVQLVVAVAFLAAEIVRNPQQDQAALESNLEHNGLLLSLATLLSVPASLVVCALAIWIRRYPLPDYLGLKRCSGKELTIGLGCLAIFIPASDGLTWLSGRPIVPDFMVSAWQTAGFLPLLFLAIVVAAPVGEELFFRGFLFRGWSESALGFGGATLLTAVLWAVIHVQYDWFFVTHIIVAGLMLGWLRYRSGSTLLTILLHAVMNFVATVEAAVQVEILS